MARRQDDGMAELPRYLERLWEKLSLSGDINLSVDMIPYSEDFNRVSTRVRAKFVATDREIFLALINLRKRGKCKHPKVIREEFAA